MNISRGRAITLLSCAVAVSSVFLALSLGTQFASYQRQVASLQSNLEASEASSELHRFRVAELEREAAEFESRIIEL